MAASSAAEAVQGGGGAGADEDPYRVRPDCVDDAAGAGASSAGARRFHHHNHHPKPGKTLSPRAWRAAFDQQGRVKNVDKVLRRVRRGGVDPSIRGEVWEFLLGCFSPHSSAEERDAIRSARRAHYAKLKAECRAMDDAVGSGQVLTSARIPEEDEEEEEPAAAAAQEAQEDGKNNNNNSCNGEEHHRGLAKEAEDGNNNNSSSCNGEEHHHGLEVEAEDGNNHSSCNGEEHRHDLKEEQQTSSGGNQEADAEEEEDKGNNKGHTTTTTTATTAATTTTTTIPEALEEELLLQKENKKKTTQWRMNLHQIGLDVVRTDRMLQFYERQENLGKLWDILAVYCWLDPDIGYCQGMSDFCSPVALMFADEADAFWCFERIMHRVRDSFKCTDHAVGVQKQLETLALLMKVLDPELHQHLVSIGGGNYIFAFRMVMVHFRREFSFQDTLYLWEMMWALEYVPPRPLPLPPLPLSISSKQQQDVLHNSNNIHNNITNINNNDSNINNNMRWRGSWIFSGRRKKYKGRGKFDAQNLKYGADNVPGGAAPIVLYCAAAIFEMQRKSLLKQTQGLDEVLKLLNDVTGKVDAKEACKSALKLHKKYLRKVRKQVQQQQPQQQQQQQ